VANEAQVNIRVAGKDKFSKELDESEKLVNKFATGVKVALAAAAAAFAFDKVRGWVGQWVSDWSEAQQAVTKMEAVLNSTGGKAGFTSEQLQQMANEIEALTGQSAESTLQMQTLLMTFDNVRGDQFKRATIAAGDLATVLGTDTAGAARLLGKALNDPRDAVSALARAGVDFSEDQKAMITSLVETGDVVKAQEMILDALESKVGGVSEAMAGTFAGKLTILNNRVGDLGESIAGMLIPVLEAMLPAADFAITGIQAIIDIIGDMLGVGEDFGTSFTDVFTDTFKWIVTLGVDTFTFFLAWYENWGLQVEQATYGWFLVFVSTFEDISHWLTKTIPTYLQWLSENWVNIFVDLGNYVSTVVSNMWTNLSNFFTNVYDYLSGNSTSFEWVGLTSGFEATLKALPEIADRELTQTEKYLNSSIKQLQKTMDANYEDRAREGREFVDKMFAEREVKISEYETNESQDRSSLAAAAAAEAKAESTGSTGSTSSSSSGSAEKQKLAGEIVGVEDLFNRIGQGSREEPIFKMMEADQQAAKIQQEVAKSSDKSLSQMLPKMDKYIAIAEQMNTNLKNLSTGLA
jgi:hypothetical protein